MSQESAYLIDWLTLRIPLGPELGEALTARIRGCLNTLRCVDRFGEILWTKQSLDVDALRSDTPGLCWMVQSDGKSEFLTIGASPASLEHGLNVFGSCDIRHCATVLIRHAAKALQSFLPPLEAWQCRRVDVTGNYVLPDPASVKQALRQLVLSDGGRRTAANKERGGDSVYWNGKSDLARGKAYHKGPQLAYLVKKGALTISDDLLELAGRVLRLEHSRGSRWFRRLAESGRDWFSLSVGELEGLFVDFFGRLVDGVEVRDMGMELIGKIAKANGISEGRAHAAFTTYTNIRAYGFTTVKGYMPARTWYLHLKYLRGVGISDSDLQQGNVRQFRPVRIILARPVTSWDDLRRAA